MNFYLKSMMAVTLIFIPHMAEAGMNLINRMLYADPDYAHEIEIKAYIITEEQTCSAMGDPQQEPTQLSKKCLYGHSTYLFLQVRNIGKKHAWGILACTVPSYHVPLDVPIFNLNSSEEYSIYLIHLGVVTPVPNKPGFPELSFEWKELYTK